MVTNPLPGTMDKEIKKSVHILKEFTAHSSTGPDTLIPPSIFAKAKGIAIISYCKMGFFVSARGGSGIVVAKLPNGRWSAPSAIGIAGIGGGLEFGAEMTAIIMMLMYSNAVKAFMKNKNVTLGGGLSVAAGPIGRDLEADVAIKSPAAMYTYARAKGLFVGINLCGTLMLERRKANERCYGPGVRSYDILSGRIDIPPNCHILHEVLREMSHKAKRKGLKQAVNIGSKVAEKKYGIKGLNKAANKGTDSALQAEDKYRSSGKTRYDSGKTRYDSGKIRYDSDTSYDDNKYRSKKGKAKFLSKKSKSPKSKPSVKLAPSRPAPTRPTPSTASKKGPAPRPATTKKAPPRPPPSQGQVWSQQTQHAPAESRVWVEALYPYTGSMSCDISFQAADRIEVLTRTQCEFDWWEGRMNGKVGIFPANYVRVVT